MPTKEFSVREGARGFAARPFIVCLKEADRLRGGGAAPPLSFSHFFTARLDKCGFVVYDYITGRGASGGGAPFILSRG